MLKHINRKRYEPETFSIYQEYLQNAPMTCITKCPYDMMSTKTRKSEKTEKRSHLKIR